MDFKKLITLKLSSKKVKNYNKSMVFQEKHRKTRRDSHLLRLLSKLKNNQPFLGEKGKSQARERARRKARLYKVWVTVRFFFFFFENIKWEEYQTQNKITCSMSNGAWFDFHFVFCIWPTECRIAQIKVQHFSMKTALKLVY